MTQSDIIPNEIELEQNEIRIELISLFEKRISEREQQILCNAHKWEDESFNMFYVRISKRIASIVVTFRAKELLGIDLFCPGLDAIFEDFSIQRRKVDELDNIYVSRKGE